MKRDTPGSRERPAGYLPALRFDLLTPVYDPVVAFTTREHKFKTTLLLLAELDHGQRVLDVGCGTGTLAIEAVKRHPGIEMVGIDGDPAVLARARRKATVAKVQAGFEQAYSTHLPFPDHSFDRVLSSLFFHHLPADQKRHTFSEVARVLAPGGRLHVADWGKPSGLAMRLLAWPLQLLDGVEYTADNIAGRLPDYMASAGLTNVAVQTTFPTAFGTMALYRAERP